MFKLLVLSCLLASCLCSPKGLGLESWLREVGLRVRGRGCADGGAGLQACAAAAPGSLAAHPRDCRLFYYCSGSDAPPTCSPCPRGLHFNPDIQVCDWPSQVNCTARPPRPHRPGPTSDLPSNETTSYPPTGLTSEPSSEPEISSATPDVPTTVATSAPPTDAPE